MAENKLARFDPYSMSKIMKYLSKSDADISQNTLKLYSLFALELVSTITQRQISLYQADLDDPLIDLELHDILDFVKVFSVLASQNRLSDKVLLKSIPDLFIKE